MLRLPPLGVSSSLGDDETPMSKTKIYTKHQGFVIEGMTIDDIERNLELQEIQYRRFKTDVYTRMKQFEEVISDLKYVVRLMREKERSFETVKSKK
jgi:hypothetical protein